MFEAKFLNKSRSYLLIFLLVIFFISEAISKYAIQYEGGKSDIPRIIKFVVFLFIIVGLLIHFKRLIAPLVLVTMFCVGQLFLKDGFRTEIMVSFSKLLFPIFLFIYFSNYPIRECFKENLFRAFEYLLILNGILIFVGLIWEIHFFKSYQGPRFGYNGLFITSATSSYVYAIAIFYFLLKLKAGFFKNWKTFFVIVCALITGTKILYIVVLASLLIYLLQFVNFNRSYRKMSIIIVLIVFGIIGYIFFFKYGIFNEIRQEKGIFSAIFSFRDDLLLEQTLPFIQENWKWPNYLFGGISDLSTRSQMGFIDIFYFLGILGGILYLYIFYKSFASFPIDEITLYILLSLSLIVFLAGNFFENASVAIYLLILKERLIMELTSSKTIGHI